MDSSSEGEPGLALLQLTPCLSLGSLTRRLASGERASGVPRRPGISTAGAACLLPAALEAQAKVGLAGVSVNIRTPPHLCLWEGRGQVDPSLYSLNPASAGHTVGTSSGMVSGAAGRG